MIRFHPIRGISLAWPTISRNSLALPTMPYSAGIATDDAPPSRLQNRATWLISQTGIHAHRLLSDALAKADARGYDYRVLAAVQEFGPTSQATLGRRTDMDRSDVAETVDDLAERGLVER